MSLSRSAISFLITTACLGGAVHTQTAKVDPQARQVLDAMMASYPALHSYSATIEVTDTVGKNPRGSVQKTHIVFQRPNEALVVSDGTEGHTKVVSDGTTLYEWEPPAKPGAKPTYHTESADAQAEGVTTAIRLGERGGSFVKDLIIDDGFLTKLSSMPELNSLTLGPEGTTDGVPTQTVIFAWKDAPGESVFTFSIGKSDHLLRRVNMACRIPGKAAKVIKVEKNSHVQANPKLDAATFDFTPPPGNTVGP
ncbi:MAG: DUF2092 domain-containing protein [Armatimonadota bacterium]|nr:DUF2092 domain-containing protein [Armatimonadota bacterium]